MNFSTTRSERITAIVSTLAAVAILAGGVTAYQSHNQPIDDTVQLESDLRFQLEVAFSHDPNERIERLAQLEQVSQAWQKSPQETADHEKLASWLLEATIRSMPGSIESLPRVPKFGKRQPAVTSPQPNILVTPPVTADEGAVTENSIAAPHTLTVEPSVAEEISDQVEQLATPTAVGLGRASPASAVVSPAISMAENRMVFEQPAMEAVTPLPVAVQGVQVIEPVRINLTELTARIAGYHNGLNEVEAALLRLANDDFKTLTEQIQQLDEMARDYHFVNMYYQALNQKERQSVTAPRPLTAMLAEVERRLDRSQAAQSGDFLEEFDSSNQEQLARLRRRLSEVASRVDR